MLLPHGHPISVRTEIGERTAETPSDRVLGLSLTAGGTPPYVSPTKVLCKGFQKGFYPFAIGQAGNRDCNLWLSNSLLAAGGLRGPTPGSPNVLCFLSVTTERKCLHGMSAADQSKVKDCKPALAEQKLVKHKQILLGYLPPTPNWCTPLNIRQFLWRRLCPRLSPIPQATAPCGCPLP